MTTQITFEGLADRPLLDAAKRLAAEERRTTAALLRALMEIDVRRLYLGEGCASMFVYCVRVLHLAEGAAYNRIEAARTARKFPLILNLFEQSAITLTTIKLLATHLTPENHADVLAAARHKTKREVEELVAALAPKPDAPAVVRKLPSPRFTPPLVAAASPSGRCDSASIAAAAPVPAAQPPLVTPLAPERYRIQLTVSRETHERFRRAQALLRHAVPSGDAAEIFDRAITCLLEDLERKRCAEVRRPLASCPASNRSRHVPAAVRRAVWRRDQGRCAFVGAAGRCGETAFLEFHHVKPFAAGGATTVDNLELRCRAHNAYEARLFFGHDVVRETQAVWASLIRDRADWPITRKDRALRHRPASRSRRPRSTVRA